jgi:hypothetical protein
MRKIGLVQYWDKWTLYFLTKLDNYIEHKVARDQRFESRRQAMEQHAERVRRANQARMDAHVARANAQSIARRGPRSPTTSGANDAAASTTTTTAVTRGTGSFENGGGTVVDLQELEQIQARLRSAESSNSSSEVGGGGRVSVDDGVVFDSDEEEELDRKTSRKQRIPASMSYSGSGSGGGAAEEEVDEEEEAEMRLGVTSSRRTDAPMRSGTRYYR